jgi:hypothetical protein
MRVVDSADGLTIGAPCPMLEHMYRCQPNALHQSDGFEVKRTQPINLVRSKLRNTFEV